jgi:nitroimidazol reductase NimA-like FMN-containing flavoprotein (pyridoxamine 5'-phosphate oxidase superfamily)
VEPLSRSASFDLLGEMMVAHLGVIADGEPYVTPTSFVLDGERILFRTSAGRKLSAMRLDPRVCLEASRFDEDTGDWMSVIVRGRAVLVDDRPTGELAVQLLLQKYTRTLGSPLDRGGMQPLPGWPQVIEIEIEEISGMASHDGFSSRTRPGRL